MSYYQDVRASEVRERDREYVAKYFGCWLPVSFPAYHIDVCLEQFLLRNMRRNPLR